MNNTKHVPVLLREVMELLNVKPGKNYVDATLGGGGYTEELLELSAPDGIVIAIDENTDAIEHARGRFGSRSHTNEKRKPSLRSRSEPLSSGGDGERLILIEGNFRHLSEHINNLNVSSISGVVFDLGLSSDLLESSGRGFSFKRDEPLLMSFSSAPRLTAREVVNTYSAPELAGVFTEYGEIRSAERLARYIYERRGKKPFETTFDLVGAVEEVLQRKSPKVLAQVFQALRIEVNDEMGALKDGLYGAWEVLDEEGRVAVVSYHSLEDRVVKHFFKAKQMEGMAEILTDKPITASQGERALNPRSTSAKLRVVKKIN